MAIRAPAANRAAAAPNRTTGKTAKTKAPTQYIFEWEGRNRKGKIFRGEMRVESITEVNIILRKQGLSIAKPKRRHAARGKKITPRDIAYPTRQLSTMLKAGVPLLQSIDIIAKGHVNPNFTQLLTEICVDTELGSSMTQAFRRHPKYFDTLYCNLIDAGEQGGILSVLLERLSPYMEKSLALRTQVESALIYPISVLTVAFLVIVVLMIFAVPSSKGVFSGFGADLLTPMLFVITISDFLVKRWIPVVLGPVAGIALFSRAFKRSENIQRSTHRFVLKVPIFDDIIRKAIITRWTRILATMFAAGTSFVESMKLVAGAAGNWIYYDATPKAQRVVCTGTSLTGAMQAAYVFDNMVLQVTQTGGESDTLDDALLKVVEFHERGVDGAVANVPTLIEPIIIVFFGMPIGGMVAAMYLPVFRLGMVV